MTAGSRSVALAMLCVGAGATWGRAAGAVPSETRPIGNITNVVTSVARSERACDDVRAQGERILARLRLEAGELESSLGGRDRDGARRRAESLARRAAPIHSRVGHMRLRLDAERRSARRSRALLDDAIRGGSSDPRLAACRKRLPDVERRLANEAVAVLDELARELERVEALVRRAGVARPRHP